MVLTDKVIKQRLQEGSIVIEPFVPENLGTNSYDLTLGDNVLIYEASFLDVKEKNDLKTVKVEWSEEGFIDLEPGELYICTSNEYTESHKDVPVIFGKSSLGRLGLFVHITAGFGDVGFCGKWTLELACVKPLRIYKGMKIAQIVWFESHEAEVKYFEKADAKYHNQQDATASKYYKNFE